MEVTTNNCLAKVKRPSQNKAMKRVMDESVSGKRWKPKLSIVVLLLLSLELHISVLASPLSSESMSGAVKNGPIPIQIMAVVPTTFGKGDPQWKKGEEILPGAHLAIKEINDVPSLLSDYRLEVIPVRVPHCNLNEGIVSIIREFTTIENITGIVGYFCHNLAWYFSHLVQHRQVSTLQISATFLDEESLPHQGLKYHILPQSESNARATAQLLQRLKWSKIAVLSSQNMNFKDTTHAFLEVAGEYGVKIALKTEVSLISYTSPKQYLQELLRFGLKIVVAFVSPSEAVEILCSVYSNGFNWPDYAWIIVENINSEIFKSCPQDVAITSINNAIFIIPKTRSLDTSAFLPSGLNYSAYYDAYLEELEKSSAELNVSLQSNPYANVLYDSIWAVALTLNGSLSLLNERNLSLINVKKDTRSEIKDVLDRQLSILSFQGATGLLNFSHRAAAQGISVELFQFHNGNSIQLGSYNYSIDQLALSEELLGDIPTDSWNRIYVLYSIPLAVILISFIVLCIALTTISMCLYFYYRREPAIKATSRTLSICLFIGCYFLLTSSLFHTMTSMTTEQNRKDSYRTFICMFDVYLISLGTDIIFATVITKTLRIYHIFNKFGNVNRICSDQGLFTLISIIVSVKIVLLIVWSALDASRVVDIEQYVSQSVPPHYLVRELCQSKHLEIWLFAHIGYSAILMLTMVLLAVMTRKIKRKEFKDSKKINILVVALIFNMCICVPLWIIFRLVDATNLSRLAYSVGTMTTAVLCLVFLIIPKIAPLVLRDCRCLNACCIKI